MRAVSLAVVTACLAATSLTACTSSSGGGAPSSVPPATVTSTATTTAPAPSTSHASTPASPSRTSAAPAGVTRCRASALRLASAGGEGAAGTSYQSFTLTNTASSTCDLEGYPGVSVIDSAGRIVQHPAKRGASNGNGAAPVRRIDIRPGRAGRFLVTSVDVTPSPGCPSEYHGARLRVYPPNDTGSLSIPYTRGFCDLRVGAVTAS